MTILYSVLEEHLGHPLGIRFIPKTRFHSARLEIYCKHPDCAGLGPLTTIERPVKEGKEVKGG